MIIERDVPVGADDGTLLRADVFRPDDSKPVPAIMTLGPYGKGVEYKDGYAAQWNWLVTTHPNILPGSKRSFMTWETADPEIWVPWGYACIRVDSRGAGRSPGMLDIFSPREVRDYYDAIEWAAQQPWCSGKVGLSGISYYAINQWLVASLQPPHLAAMIPWEGAADAYRDWWRHGGILSNAFYEAWYPRQVLSNQHGNPAGRKDPWMGELATGPESMSDEELKSNRVDALQQALKNEFDGTYYRDRSPDWSRVTVPFLSAASWAGFGLHPRGNFEAFSQAASTQKWLECHPGMPNPLCDSTLEIYLMLKYSSNAQGRHEEWYYLDRGMELQKHFLDHFLKGSENGWNREPSVRLNIRRPFSDKFELRKEQDWPLPNTNWTKFYLDAKAGALGMAPVVGTESFTFEALGEPLIFMSPPLETETEITGPLAATLFISSSTTDADLFLTFQAFSPDDREVEFQGTVDPHTPLAQGWLRASHRKLSLEHSKPYRPFHTHDEEMPLTPDEIYKVEVEIWPTNIVLPKDYRIALLIGGKDFERAPPKDPNEAWVSRGSGPFLHTHKEDRPPEVFGGRTTVHTGEHTSSYLLLPIIKSN